MPRRAQHSPPPTPPGALLWSGLLLGALVAMAPRAYAADDEARAVDLGRLTIDDCPRREAREVRRLLAIERRAEGESEAWSRGSIDIRCNGSEALLAVGADGLTRQQPLRFQTRSSRGRARAMSLVVVELLEGLGTELAQRRAEAEAEAEAKAAAEAAAQARAAAEAVAERARAEAEARRTKAAQRRAERERAAKRERRRREAERARHAGPALWLGVGGRGTWVAGDDADLGGALSADYVLGPRWSVGASGAFAPASTTGSDPSLEVSHGRAALTVGLSLHARRNLHLRALAGAGVHRMTVTVGESGTETLTASDAGARYAALGRLAIDLCLWPTDTFGAGLALGADASAPPRYGATRDGAQVRLWAPWVLQPHATLYLRARIWR